MKNTPRRSAKALGELLNGENELNEINWKTFDIHEPGELVLIKGIAFQSLCEHHILPFAGTVSVAYIPSKKVVGLSKIPRLVKAISHLRDHIGKPITSHDSGLKLAKIILWETPTSCAILEQ